VNRIDTDILVKIKRSLLTCLEQLENEAIILIDAEGKHWVNDLARKIIAQRGIAVEEFTEWIKLGSSHLQDISYHDICVHLCRLPNKEVVSILKPECKDLGTIKDVDLTEKQKEILRYVLVGFTNKEIAHRMNLSPSTVNTHLDNIYSKLGCSYRLEASLIALKNGLFLHSRKILPKEKS
jgi:DNA-binding CsgD family transcriptional regulator